MLVSTWLGGCGRAACHSALALGSLALVCCTSTPPADQGIGPKDFALTLAPTVGGVDAPVFGPVATATQPRVAYGDQQFLVVWADQRGVLRDVAAARVSAEGTLLDPQNLTFPAAARDRDKPAVAFDGTHYLVVWEEQGASYTQIYGLFVEPDGRIAGKPLAIPAKSISASCHDPAVVFDGQNFVVVWTVDSTRPSQVGVRLSTAGTLLDTSAKTLVQSTNSTISAPVLANDAQGTALAWVQGGNAYVGRLAADLSAVSVTSPALGPGSIYEGMALASAGDELWLAWYDPSSGEQGGGLRAQRLAGDTLAPVADSLLVAPESESYANYPALLNLGSGMALVSSRRDAAYDYRQVITRFSAAGAIQGTAQQVLIEAPASAQHAAFAAADADGLLVWNDLRRGGTGVYGARISASGALADGAGMVVARALNKQIEPQAAAAENGFLLAWLDSRDGGTQIYGTVLDEQGTVTHATATAVTAEASKRAEFTLASDGEGYLAVWQDQSTGAAIGQLTATDGTPSGSPFSILPHGISIRVAFSGGRYLVIANDKPHSTWNVVAARVSTAGTVLDTTPVLLVDDGFRPRVTSDGTNFLVYWRQDSGVSGVRVSSASGQLIDTTPKTLTPAAANIAGYPEAAFGAQNYLIAWQDLSSAANISGTRLDKDLNLVDTTPLTIAKETVSGSAEGIVPDSPAVAFDGTHYSVVYTNAFVKGGNITYETWLGGVETDGSIRTPVKVTANDDSDSILESRPIAASSSGRTLIAYTLYDQPLGYSIDRVRYRTYASTKSTLGGGCNVNGDCTNGVCVDGVCCESACAGGTLDCQACSLVSGSSSNGSCEPLTDGAPCGTRGTCDSGTCVTPATGGASGAGGSATTGGSANGGKSSGGRSSGGAASGGKSNGGMPSAAGASGDSGAGGDQTGSGGDTASGGTRSGTGSGGGVSGGGRSAAGAATLGGNAGSTKGGNGATSGSNPKDDSDGCGCRVAPRDPPTLAGWSWVMLALSLVRRRGDISTRITLRTPTQP